MTTFDVKIVGLDKLKKKFNEAPEIAEPIYQQAVAKSAAVLASHTVPGIVPWKTGTLARSFMPVEIKRLLARWYPKVDYAKILDQGGKTRPHVILPKNGEALYWPGARHPVKKVNHPGSKIQPRYFMRKIVRASANEINTIFRNALAAVIKKL